jgi:hypothetical protein
VANGIAARRHEPLRRPDAVARKARLDEPLRELVVVQMHEMAAKDLPLANPRVLPERPRASARKLARRIDLLPRAPMLLRDPVDVGEVAAKLAIGAQVRNAVDLTAGMGPVPESHSELAKRTGL